MIHVEVFNPSVSLVASDPEGLDTFIPGPPRRPDLRSSTLKSEEPHKGSNGCDPLASFFGVLQTAGRCHAVAGFDAVQFHQSKVLPDLIAAVAF